MQPLLRAPPPPLPDAARPGTPVRWGAGEAAGSAGSGSGSGTGGARSRPALGGGTDAPAWQERDGTEQEGSWTYQRELYVYAKRVHLHVQESAGAARKPPPDHLHG